MKKSPLLFPKPLGPYAVGTKVFHLIDKRRQELYSHKREDFSPLNRTDHRELLIKLYYPSRGVKKAHKINFPVLP
jgi:hypothetical protein